MPHSVSPQSSPPSEDDILPDAPAQDEHGETQHSQEDGEDATTTQLVIEDKSKLEDLFDDDDDEFTSSMDVDKGSQPQVCVGVTNSPQRLSNARAEKSQSQQNTQTLKSCVPSISASSLSDISSNG